MDPQDIHNGFLDQFGDPEVLQANPGIAAAATDQFQGDDAIRAYTAHVGDLYQQRLASVGEGDFARQARPLFEQGLKARVQEHVLGRLADQQQAGPDGGEYWLNRLPLGGVVGGSLDADALHEAAVHLPEDRGTRQDYLTVARQLARERFEAQRGTGGKVLDVATRLPGAAAEFALSGGTGTAAEEGAQVGIAQYLRQLATREGATAAVRGAAGRAASTVTTQAALAPARIASQVAQATAPKPVMTPQGLQMRPGEDWAPAVAKAVAADVLQQAAFGALDPYSIGAGRTMVGRVASMLAAGELSEDAAHLLQASPRGGAAWRLATAGTPEERQAAATDLLAQGVGAAVFEAGIHAYAEAKSKGLAQPTGAQVKKTLGEALTKTLAGQGHNPNAPLPEGEAPAGMAPPPQEAPQAPPAAPGPPVGPAPTPEPPAAPAAQPAAAEPGLDVETLRQALQKVGMPAGKWSADKVTSEARRLGVDKAQEVAPQAQEPQKAATYEEPPAPPESESPEAALRRKLLTSKKFPDVPSRLAFDEAQEHEAAPAVALTDVDAMGKMEKARGDQVLRGKVEALRAAGLEPFHAGQDEFLVRGQSAEDLKAKLEDARQRLRKSHGADFSYGIGTDLSNVDEPLREMKAARQGPPQVFNTEHLTEPGAEGLDRLTDAGRKGAPVHIDQVMQEAGLTAREQHLVRERLVGRSHEEIAGDEEMLKKDGRPYTRQRLKQMEQAALGKMGAQADFSLASVHAQEQTDRALDLIEKGSRVRAGELHLEEPVLARQVKQRFSRREAVQQQIDDLTSQWLKEAEGGELGPERDAHYRAEAARLSGELARAGRPQQAGDGEPAGPSGEPAGRGAEQPAPVRPGAAGGVPGGEPAAGPAAAEQGAEGAAAPRPGGAAAPGDREAAGRVVAGPYFTRGKKKGSPAPQQTGEPVHPVGVAFLRELYQQGDPVRAGDLAEILKGHYDDAGVAAAVKDAKKLLPAEPTTQGEQAKRLAFGRGAVRQQAGELRKAEVEHELWRRVADHEQAAARGQGLSERAVGEAVRGGQEDGVSEADAAAGHEPLPDDERAAIAGQHGPGGSVHEVEPGVFFRRPPGGPGGPEPVGRPEQRGVGDAFPAAPSAEERLLGSVGGGQPDAPGQEPDRWGIALANARIDKERQANQLPPLLAAARRANPEVWDRAMARLEQDPDAGKKLVDELASKPRATTVDENALLLQRQVALRNEHARSMLDAIAAAKPGSGADAVTKQALFNREAELLAEIDKADKVARATGTEWGRAGQFRRQLAAEDYSLAGMLLQAQAARTDKPLSPQEKEQVLALQKQIETLQKQLDEARAAYQPPQGQPTATQVMQAAQPMQQAQTQLQGAKGQWQQTLQGLRNQNLTPAQRLGNLWLRFRRAEVLSSPATLAKIAAAATQRGVLTPLEEAAGSLWSRVPGIAKIAAMAPRQGKGLNLGAERQAFLDTFGQGMRDSWQALRSWGQGQGGASELDLLYGKGGGDSGWLELPGALHAALKAPIKRAEYTRSMLQRIDHALANGQDATSPGALARIGLAAYGDSQRAVFMQDNAVVGAYRGAVNKLRASGPAGQAAAVVADTAAPIVRVPTNVIAETLEHVAGLPLGVTKALTKGASGLSPEQADVVMRQLKKGSLGGAALAVGVLAPQLFGGLYQDDEKRKAGDVKPGATRTPLGDVPALLQHHPLLMTAQVGATFRRALDAEYKKQGYAAAPLAALDAAVSMGEETPFLKEPAQLTKFTNAKERGYAFGQFAKSLAEPALFDWLAKGLDVPQGQTPFVAEPVKRSPKTITQHLESGVPGLRQRVPPAKGSGLIRR